MFWSLPAWAAAADGPNTGTPPARSASATPSTSGCSGPTTTRPTLLAVHQATTASLSATSRSGRAVTAGSAATPALPGAQNSARALRGLGQLPGQRVLARAGPDDEDVELQGRGGGGVGVGVVARERRLRLRGPPLPPYAAATRSECHRCMRQRRGARNRCPMPAAADKKAASHLTHLFARRAHERDASPPPAAGSKIGARRAAARRRGVAVGRMAGAESWGGGGAGGAAPMRRVQKKGGRAGPRGESAGCSDAAGGDPGSRHRRAAL